MKKCEFCGAKVANRRRFCSKKCYGQDKRKNSNILTEEYLLLEYVKNRKETSQIAKEKNCSVDTLFRYLKKYNIPNRGCFIDYSNTKVGKLFVSTKIDNVKYKSGEHVRWNCECECGNKLTRISSSLIQNKLQCCEACFRKSRRAKEVITDFMFNQIKYSGIRRGKFRQLEFSITKVYIWELFLKQNKKCALSGLDLVFGETAKLRSTGHTTASLDRIDSSKGYIEGNVQWLHKDINIMKMALNQDKFIGYCDIISKNMSKIT